MQEKKKFYIKDVINKIIIIFCFILSISVSIIIYQGYDLYRNRINELPIEKMVANIQSKEDFTKVEELLIKIETEAEK